MKNSSRTALKGVIAFVFAMICAAGQVRALQAPRAFEQARAPRAWKFPRDHGRHAGFQTEWWYYTGNLRSAEGRRLGYQLTFFRNALAPTMAARASQWAFREGYVAHFTLTEVEQERFYYDQRMARDALDLAGAADDSLAVHVGAWSAVAKEGAMHLQAQSDFGSVALKLLPSRELVLHGEGGLVRKGANEGEASYYYSWPFLQTSGSVRIGADTMRVEGVSWMDHEFFSAPKVSAVAGWDWFSLHLSDSSAIMLYRLREGEGALSKFSAGTLMARGKSETIVFEATPRAWWQSAKTGAQYPIAWDLKVADYDLRVTVTVREQELDSRMTTGVVYWEGYIVVSGSKHGQPITGIGYLEMTGYAQRVALNRSQ